MRRGTRPRRHSDPIFRQKIEQFVVFIVDRLLGQGAHESVIELTQRDRLIDRLLALSDLGLTRLIIEEKRGIGRNQEKRDGAQSGREPNEPFLHGELHIFASLGAQSRLT